MGLKLGLLLEYSIVFEAAPPAVEDLLVGIPKLVIVQLATTWLGTEKSEQAGYEIAIDSMFRTENHSFRDDILHKIRTTYVLERSRPFLYSLESSLKLLQAGLKPDNETSELKNEIQIELDIFKAVLIINEKLANRYSSSIPVIEARYPQLSIPLQLLTMGFPANEIENFDFRREFGYQTVKAFMLFSFVKGCKMLEYHRAQFCSKYRIANLMEYYNKLYPTVMALSYRKTGGFFELNVPQDDNFTENMLFLSQLATIDYHDDEDIDYKEIRSKPLVELAEGRFRVTHPLFIVDKIFKTLFFEFAAINVTAPANLKIKDFRSFFTTAFSEKCLFYKVVKYAFGKKYIQYSDENMETLGLVGRFDYYIRDGNSIFLFENKDVLINAKVKESGTFEMIEQELLKKFRSDNGRGKATKQIATNIAHICAKENPFDTDYKVKHLKVYPILVVHDSFYDIMGFRELLQLWLDEDLSNCMHGREQPQVIKPLVVLNINTLLLICQTLKENKRTLKQILEEYLPTTRPISPKQFRSFSEAEQKMTNHLLPASRRIDEQLSNSGKEKSLLEFAKMLFQEMDRT